MRMLRRNVSFFHTWLAFGLLGVTGWIAYPYFKNSNKDIFLQTPSASMRERLALETQMIAMLAAQDGIVRITSVFEKVKVSGTGFSILGAIITANHVTADSSTASVYIEGKEIVMPVIKGVQTKDVSFITFPENANLSGMPYMPAKLLFTHLFRQKTLKLKDALVGLRCMSSGEPRVVLGELAFYDSAKNEFGMRLRQENTSGCSGGPVITYDGLVIGIYQSHGGLLGQALDINDVAEALTIVKSKNHSL